MCGKRAGPHMNYMGRSCDAMHWLLLNFYNNLLKNRPTPPPFLLLQRVLFFKSTPLIMHSTCTWGCKGESKKQDWARGGTNKWSQTHLHISKHMTKKALQNHCRIIASVSQWQYLRYMHRTCDATSWQPKLAKLGLGTVLRQEPPKVTLLLSIEHTKN